MTTTNLLRSIWMCEGDSLWVYPELNNTKYALNTQITTIFDEYTRRVSVTAMVTRLCWNWCPSALKNRLTWRSIFTNVAHNMAGVSRGIPGWRKWQEREQCFKLNNVARFHSHRYIIACFIINNSGAFSEFTILYHYFVALEWSISGISIFFGYETGLREHPALNSQSFYEAQLAIIVPCFWQLLHHSFCGNMSKRIVPCAPLITVNRLTLERINALG
jgi:hypothetical protein